MFGSQERIDFLRNLPDWFMDGTFDTVPPQFLQLYTVQGYNRGKNAVGIYVLLQNKTEVAYERMMNHMNLLTDGVVPNSTNVDFERGAINAVETLYPNTSKWSCTAILTLFWQGESRCSFWQGGCNFTPHFLVIKKSPRMAWKVILWCEYVNWTIIETFPLLKTNNGKFCLVPSPLSINM